MRGSRLLFFYHLVLMNEDDEFALGISGGESIGQVPKWPKGADCKSVAIGFQGSNPCLPTTSEFLD